MRSHVLGFLAQWLAETKHSIHVNFSYLRNLDPCLIHCYASVAYIGDHS